MGPKGMYPEQGPMQKGLEKLRTAMRAAQLEDSSGQLEADLLAPRPMSASDSSPWQGNKVISDGPDSHMLSHPSLPSASSHPPDLHGNRSNRAQHLVQSPGRLPDLNEEETQLHGYDSSNPFAPPPPVRERSQSVPATRVPRPRTAGDPLPAQTKRKMPSFLKDHARVLITQQLQPGDGNGEEADCANPFGPEPHPKPEGATAACRSSSHGAENTAYSLINKGSAARERLPAARPPAAAAAGARLASVGSAPPVSPSDVILLSRQMIQMEVSGSPVTAKRGQAEHTHTGQAGSCSPGFPVSIFTPGQVPEDQVADLQLELQQLRMASDGGNVRQQHQKRMPSEGGNIKPQQVTDGGDVKQQQQERVSEWGSIDAEQQQQPVPAASPTHATSNLGLSDKTVASPLALAWQEVSDEACQEDQKDSFPALSDVCSTKPARQYQQYTSAGGAGIGAEAADALQQMPPNRSISVPGGGPVETREVRIGRPSSGAGAACMASWEGPLKRHWEGDDPHSLTDHVPAAPSVQPDSVDGLEQEAGAAEVRSCTGSIRPDSLLPASHLPQRQEEHGGTAAARLRAAKRPCFEKTAQVASVAELAVAELAVAELSVAELAVTELVADELAVDESNPFAPIRQVSKEDDNPSAANVGMKAVPLVPRIQRLSAAEVNGKSSAVQGKVQAVPLGPKIQRLSAAEVNGKPSAVQAKVQVVPLVPKIQRLCVAEGNGKPSAAHAKGQAVPLGPKIQIAVAEAVNLSAAHARGKAVPLVPRIQRLTAVAGISSPSTAHARGKALPLVPKTQRPSAVEDGGNPFAADVWGRDEAKDLSKDQRSEVVEEDDNPFALSNYQAIKDKRSP